MSRITESDWEPWMDGQQAGVLRSTMTTSTQCNHPGCQKPHDNWPDGTPDGLLCQECWEAQCSREWWQMLHDLDRAGVEVLA